MPVPTTPRLLAEYFWAGYYDQQVGFTHCPHREGSEEASVWELGFRASDQFFNCPGYSEAWEFLGRRDFPAVK